MVRELIESEIEVEHEDGPMRIQTMGKGGVKVTGPTKGFEDGDPHITIRLGHEDEPVTYDDDYETETGDYAEASTHLTLDEAQELYEVLGDALKETPTVLFEDMKIEE